MFGSWSGLRRPRAKLGTARKGTRGMSDLLILHTIGMEKYQGFEKNIVAGGFQIAKDNGYGYEMFNFKEINGYCYGYAPVRNRTINIRRLGAGSGDESISGVLVVWTAPYRGGGRRIVGWYKNAEVFQKEQPGHATARRYKGAVFGYNVKVKASDYVLLPTSRRSSIVKKRYRISHFPDPKSKVYRDFLSYVKKTKK